jgi:hypothetical protein
MIQRLRPMQMISLHQVHPQFTRNSQSALILYIFRDGRQQNLVSKHMQPTVWFLLLSGSRSQCVME